MSKMQDKKVLTQGLELPNPSMMTSKAPAALQTFHTTNRGQSAICFPLVLLTIFFLLYDNSPTLISSLHFLLLPFKFNSCSHLALKCLVCYCYVIHDSLLSLL